MALTWTSIGASSSGAGNLLYATARSRVENCGFDPEQSYFYWNGSTWTNISGSASPHVPGSSGGFGRYGGVGVYTPNDDNVVFFGGNDNAGTFLDRYDTTIYFDGTGWLSFTPAHHSTKRFLYGAGWDARNNYELMFGGGQVLGTYDNETWTWNGTDWTHRTPVHFPSARASMNIEFDYARNELVLFGGLIGPTTFSNETWVWDGTDYTQKFPAHSPPNTHLGRMGYDPISEKIYWIEDTAFNTWSWDGTDWTLETIVTPHAGTANGVIYDSTHSYLMAMTTAGTYKLDGVIPAPPPDPSTLTGKLGYYHDGAWHIVQDQS